MIDRNIEGQVPLKIPKYLLLSLRVPYTRTEDEDEQRLGDEDPGYATIRSTMSNNHDEGYSTVDETLQRAGNKVRTTERYASGVNMRTLTYIRREWDVHSSELYTCLE